MRVVLRNRSLAAQYVVIAIASLFILGSIVSSWHQSSGPPDFADFYCAGAAKASGGNPYLWKDLDRCGGRSRAFRPASMEVHRTPSPIPGYDVAFFRILAGIPYVRAGYVWLVLSTLALGTAVVTLSAVAGVPPLVVFAAFAMPLFRTAVGWGQLPPLLIAFVSVAAYAVRRGMYGVAGVAAACTLIEPHLGVPICAAMFLWLPQTRVALAVCCLALGALSLGTLGFGGNVDYVKTILPLQMHAEVPFSAQYSLSWALYWLGFDENFAALAGNVSYLVAIVFGVYFANRLSKSLQAPEFVPVVPAAFAVIGGPYVHIHQAEMSVLCALMLAGRLKSLFAWSSVALLSAVWFTTPWLEHPWTPVRLGSGIALALIVAFALKGRSLLTRGLAAGGAVAVYFLGTALLLHAGGSAFRYPEALNVYSERIATESQYSSAQWGYVLHAPTRFSSIRDLLFKIPIWVALGVVALCVYFESVRVKGPGATRA